VPHWALCRTGPCAALGAEYRHTKPRSPQTNGLVERFNGRIGSEVLTIAISFHHQLEQLLRGFNAAYNNARRQRVLEAKTPDQVVAERLTAKPALAKDKPAGRAGPCDITKARLIAESAKEVSQPDTAAAAPHHGRCGSPTRCRSRDSGHHPASDAGAPARSIWHHPARLRD